MTESNAHFASWLVRFEQRSGQISSCSVHWTRPFQETALNIVIRNGSQQFRLCNQSIDAAKHIIFVILDERLGTTRRDLLVASKQAINQTIVLGKLYMTL